MFGFIYTIIGFAIFWGLVIFAVWFLWKNRNILKATKFKDWFSVRKWTSVLYSYAVSTLFPFHVIEQMVIRLYDEDCKGYIEEIDPSTGKTVKKLVTCRENGSCVHCGCDMIKAYTPWDRCSEGNWGAMELDKEKYSEIRRNYPVKIKVEWPE
jgi:hypothetical protein